VKGKQVYVEGNPEVRTFTRQDGTAGASLSLRVREVQLLGGRGDAGGGSLMSESASGATKSSIPNPADITEPVDDLPF
jgi:single-strand DNA-binding protein